MQGTRGRPNIDVVVPVLGHDELTRQLLDCMKPQAAEVERVIIIDNANAPSTARLVSEYSLHLPLQYVPQPRNSSVNSAWNLGLSMAHAKLVSVLNNDVILPPSFFRSVKEAFVVGSRVGIAVPAVAPNPRVALKTLYKPVTLAPLLCREGWAFTIVREVFSHSGPIPSALVTYFGDDFLFAVAQDLGFALVRMANVPVFHYVNATVRVTDAYSRFELDRQAWRRIVASRMARSRNPRIWAAAAAGRTAVGE